MQPGQKNQMPCRTFPSIQFHRIPRISPSFILQRREVSNSSAVIISRSKMIARYTNKSNRLLVFSTYIETGIKIIYCLISIQLYICALGCRTDISFKNILKNIFRPLLNCKLLPQNILNKSNSI